MRSFSESNFICLSENEKHDEINISCGNVEDGQKNCEKGGPELQHRG